MKENTVQDVNVAHPVSPSHNVTIVSRAEWGAREPKAINYMGTPVSVVFIHHTAESEGFNQEECSKVVRDIQTYHMDVKGWDDIAYNFLVGGDGKVYEGRSWDRVGAHTLSWNDVAIAFSFMGNFTETLPNTAALDSVKEMIETGVKLGKISPNYKLYGHRNVGQTCCPGDRLYELIKSWEHFNHDTPVKPSPVPQTPTPNTSSTSTETSSRSDVHDSSV